MLERCWKRWPGIRENLRNCNDFICKSCSIVAEADDPFPMCITDGDEFETFNELLSWWRHRAGWRMHWCCYYPYLICLEGFAWTFTCILKVYHFKTVEKCARSVLLYGSKTWPMSKGDLSSIKTSGHAVIQWICGVKLEYSKRHLKRHQAIFINLS